ncbi:MAG: hypothetical protein Q8N87_01595 [bacterium]|nr:hypothetical protein [bacterium]
MEEIFKPKIEGKTESEQSATDIHTENLNPELWREFVCLSPKQQDERWFNLTQEHLKDYRGLELALKEPELTKESEIEEKIKLLLTTEKFKSEELELFFLNQLFAKSIPSLSPEMPQRGFYFDPEQPAKQRMKKFGNFGNFIETIQEEAEKHKEKISKPFQVLVGGIGISGKATTRTVLAKELSERVSKSRVISWDRDYQKIFPIPAEWQGDINIIEDVHGLNEKRDENEKLKRFDGSEGLPEGYDMVVYVISSAATFRQSLIKRGIGWLQIGKMDLTAPEKQYPEEQKEKIKQTAEELERFLPVARKWFREQLRVLRELKNRGVKIAIVDPSEIFKKLYKFEEKPEFIDKSFSEVLKMLWGNKR